MCIYKCIDIYIDFNQAVTVAKTFAYFRQIFKECVLNKEQK